MPIVPRARRRLSHAGLPVASLFALAALACDSKPAPKPADPNQPAVIRVPQPVLPSDTAGRGAAAPGPAVSLVQAKVLLSGNYALLGMAIVGNDRRIIGSYYGPASEFITSDTTYRGEVQIANSLGASAIRQALKEFRRESLVTSITDSVVSDSGTYVIVGKRPGADSLYERGRYASTWRIRPAPLDWIMTRDRLYRDPVKPKK